MARRYTPKDRRRRDDRMGAVLIAVAVLATAIIGLLIWYTQQPKRSMDNGCTVGLHGAYPAHTIILIDQTDALPKPELGFARDLIYNEYMWLPENGLLTVRSITASVDANKDGIGVCRVKVGAEGNGVTDNSAALEQAYRKMVGNKLDRFLGNMATAPTQKASPIAESVDELLQRTDFDHDVKQRRLIILSDMAQYSSAYSQYGKSWKSKFKLPLEFLKTYDSDMSGVTVRVQYIKRASVSFQGPAHKKFWKTYFAGKNARDTEIGHSLGLGEDPGKKVWHMNAGQ